jgi:hypothetical protein
MKPVDTILQVGAFYNAIGFSSLYTSLFGSEPNARRLFISAIATATSSI